jgi:hypothetical protein
MECTDLTIKGSCTPVLIGGLIHIPDAGVRFIDSQECTVVCPAQFGTQCVPIWKKCVERSHVPQISLIETFAKFSSKAFSKVSEQAPAISGAGSSSLIEFDDVLPDSPAGLNLHYINGMQDLLAGGLYHFALPTISPRSPPVSFSRARMSALISASVRSGCGL